MRGKREREREKGRERGEKREVLMRKKIWILLSEM